MSSKFFTWGHRGDRKPSPYGIVPIPAECITIKGIDAKGSHKNRRKPLPLDLYHPPEITANERNRADDSIAFHDAAVQSATSLLAVINDCLKSPQLNAHLMSTQQSQTGLQPMHGRPRSRTAPSTPMAEAPSGSKMSPVELPGSMPPVKRSHASHQSMDSRALRNILTLSTDKSAVGQSIERPHSSPQESTYRLPSYPRKSSDSFSRSAMSLQPPADPVPRPKTSSPYRGSQSNKLTPFSISDDTLVASESDTSLATMRRPSLDMLSGGRTSSPAGKASSQPSSSYLVPQIPSASLIKPLCDQGRKQTMDYEGMMIEQVSAMRAAHDAHLNVLKEAHEKEIASHRSYVSFLERRLATQSASHQSLKQNLKIDTSQLPNKDLSLLSSDVSATASMQSFEMTTENQKRASSEAAAEAQKLRRERDHMKDSAERSERRVSQLRSIVRKAKENETALKDAIAGLQASLLSANNERLDVLEGFHEACEQLRVLGKECDEFRNRLCHADPNRERGDANNQSSCARKSEELVGRSTSLRKDALIQQLDELRQNLSARNMRIEQLEQQLASTRPATTSIDAEGAGRADLEHCQQQLAAAQADRDRYDSLLHTELRRQSRLAAQKAHKATPALETEVLSAMRERLNRLKDTSNCTGEIHNEADAGTSILEKELEHCVKEIIMYKLDVKGYKKDLKSAKAEVEKLRLQQRKASNEIAIPHSQNDRPTSSGQNPATSSAQDKSGLGISMPPLPVTPQRTAGSTSAPTLLSASSTPQRPPSALSPQHRLQTPLGVHKKLPKPPPPQSRTPSPYLTSSPPRAEVHRQETMRSLSESIISSYAKRSTPEQRGQDATSPPRGRSSDPLRKSMKTEGCDDVNDVKVVPMAKFTPRMLRASARVLGTAAV